MLIGLVVGALLGICISIILLAIVKDFVKQTRSDEETAAALNEKG